MGGPTAYPNGLRLTRGHIGSIARPTEVAMWGLYALDTCGAFSNAADAGVVADAIAAKQSAIAK